MRRVLVVVGLVLLGLGGALFFSVTRTEVQRALAQGDPVQMLIFLETGIPPDGPNPMVAVLVSLLPQKRCVWVVIPGQLLVPVAGAWRPLGEHGDKAASALAALLELPLLGAVEVSAAVWDGLVADLGGVVARPQERLIYQDPFRQVFIDIPAGEQLLGGQKSRELLAYLLQYGGKPDLAGLHAFFADLVGRLSGRPEVLRKAFTSATLSPWAARDFWSGVAHSQARLEVLPLVEEEGKLRPDVVRIRKLRESLVSGRTFLTRDEVRLFLVNGTRERFLASRTAAWLSARGFQVVGVGQADRQDYPKTLLLVRKGTEDKAELLRTLLPQGVSVILAETFGMERLGGWPEGADVVLLLGAGFDVGA